MLSKSEFCDEVEKAIFLHNLSFAQEYALQEKSDEVIITPRWVRYIIGRPSPIKKNKESYLKYLKRWGDETKRTN